MRSLEKLGLEDVTRLELGQFLEDGFPAAHFKWFPRLRQTWNRGAECNHYTQNSSLFCSHSWSCIAISNPRTNGKAEDETQSVQRRERFLLRPIWRSITPLRRLI